MGDIIDKAQENDELFRRVSLNKHFAQSKITASGGRLAMTNRVCIGCGEPIPKKRLKANPEATRCVKCQGLVEKNGEDFLAND